MSSIGIIESDLLAAAQFVIGPRPKPPFFSVKPIGDRLGERIDSKDSSASSRSRQPGLALLEKHGTEFSMPHSSVVSSVVIVEKDQGGKKLTEGLREVSKAKYLERVTHLDLEDLACRREFMETLELKSLSHEDLSSHFCVDCLKAHDAHFSPEKNLETVDLSGIPKRAQA